jgi:hypothetical protein
MKIGPLFQRLASGMGDNPTTGIELLCRILYDMQQDYFGYLNQLNATGNATVPTFSQVINLVSTFRADSLSPLPQSWYTLAGWQMVRGYVAVTRGASAPSPRPGTAALNGPVVNAHADTRLMQRYKDAGFASITAMVGGRQLEYPKHANKPVCMSWALKGSCSAGCKRAAQHVRYGSAVVTALHRFLDECGVANPQP